MWIAKGCCYLTEAGASARPVGQVPADKFSTQQKKRVKVKCDKPGYLIHLILADYPFARKKI